tara:strand:- start:710 stop:1012 length:303 start_codon:yes stop_codon:yes gene_type:complete
MRILFRIIISIPIWLFLQGPGTLAFTMFFIIPLLCLWESIYRIIMYLGTGKKEHLDEFKFAISGLLTIFGGTLCCYSWIKTGDFDIDNFGTTHLEKKSNS